MIDCKTGNILHSMPDVTIMLLYITCNDAAHVSLHCRVLQKAQQEADNSEEPAFVDRLNDAIRNLRGSK